MKRIEKMSKEAIVELFLADCPNCNLHSAENPMHCSIPSSVSCERIKQNYLNEEIDMVSRWQTCKTDEDFEQLIRMADNNCRSRENCRGCRLYESCAKYNGNGRVFIIAYALEKVDPDE